MSAILTVARREIAERKLVLAAGAATGVLALLAPLMPVWNSWDTRELILATSGALAYVLAAVLAALLGGSVLSRELAEGRLGFYLSRPLPALAMWAGKLLAAWVLAVTAGLLAGTPALVMALWPSSGLEVRDLPVSVGVPALIALAVVAVAHAVSVMGRSRSPWLVVDLVGAFLGYLAFSRGARALIGLGPTEAMVWGMWGTMGMLLAAFLVAGAVATCRGRWSIRATHAALSVTLWLGVLLASGALAAFAGWIRSAGPEDIVEIGDVQPAPQGPWVAVSGTSRWRFDYEPKLLLDTDSGRFLRIGQHSSMAFSDDGTTAAWLVHDLGDRALRYRLWYADLAATAPRALETSVTVDFEKVSDVPDLVLDENGRRALLRAAGTISVVSLPAGDQIGAAKLPEKGGDWSAAFVDERVELYHASHRDRPQDDQMLDGDLSLFDYDPTGRTLTHRWTVELPSHRSPRLVMVLGARLLAVTSRLESGAEGLLLDRVSGEMVAREEKGPYPSASTPLEDGSVLTASIVGARVAAYEVSPDGQRGVEIDLGRGRWMVMGAEVEPGVVFATVNRAKAGTFDWQLEGVLIDVHRGSYRSLGRNLLPALRWWRPQLTLPAVGSPGARLLRTDRASLLRLDPKTGALELILGSYPPEEERP